MTTPSAAPHPRDWFYARGSLERDGWETVVDTAISGWRYTGIRVAAVSEGGSAQLAAEAVERIVVPLAGSFTVRYTLAGETEPRVQVLAGRASVFHGPTDTLYLPTGTALSIEGAGRVAVAEAPTDQALPVAYIPTADVPIELRGAGRSSRQVHNFGTPAAREADRFIVCEVLTPAGNWSSYPPHKHDEERIVVHLLVELYARSANEASEVLEGTARGILEITSLAEESRPPAHAADEAH